MARQAEGACMIVVDYFCEVCWKPGHPTDHGYFCDEHDPGEPTYD